MIIYRAAGSGREVAPPLSERPRSPSSGVAAGQPREMAASVLQFGAGGGAAAAAFAAPSLCSAKTQSWPAAADASH